jgi:hypothetical protein
MVLFFEPSFRTCQSLPVQVSPQGSPPNRM